VFYCINRNIALLRAIQISSTQCVWAEH